MRRLLAVLLLLAAYRAAAAAPAGSDTLARDLAAVAAFFPRPEGSSGEAGLLAHLSARLAESGIAATRFDFDESAEGYSYSSCLSARIEGRLADTLLVVAPLNHSAGAGPGASGDINVALALELLRRSREQVPAVTLTVLFLGAEYGDGEGYPMGSALFLRDFQPTQRVAVLYLGLTTGSSPVLVRASGRGVGSPGWLVARSTAALADAGVPYRLRAGELAVDRLGLGGQPTIVEPWLKAGIPAVALEDSGEPSVAPAADSAAVLAAFLDRFLALSADGLEDEWDNHYLPITAGGRTLVAGEAVWVSVVAGLLALLLLFSLVFARGLKKYARALARTGWVLLPLLGLAVAALVAATLGLEGLLALRAFPTLWTWRPGVFLAAKLAAATLLAFAAVLPLARLGIDRHASLLSAAALLLLLVDVLVVLAIDVSLTFPFLWAFCWVFLASRARSRMAKLAFFLPSALLIIAGFVEALSSPSLPLSRFLLFSRWWGNLLIAVLALPFLLFLLRIGLALPVRPGRREPGRRVLGVLALVLPAAAAVGLGAWAALWSPFSPSSPRPVTVEQAIDANGASRLAVSSPVPLRAVTVTDRDGERTMVVPGREASIDLAPSKASVAVSAQSTASLGRVNVTLTISAPAPVRRLTAVLSGGTDFVLYDCTFPFVREEAGRYRLLAGAFPPSPLSLGLTVPEGGAYRLDLELELDSPLLDVRFSVPSSRVEERVRIFARVDIPT
ncbi:MAG: hypothetical protein NTU62_06955 [Spirochaetes bacterium]|nr:hypothetical protein [Spirochaetota bacterium]